MNNDSSKWQFQGGEYIQKNSCALLIFLTLPILWVLQYSKYYSTVLVTHRGKTFKGVASYEAAVNVSAVLQQDGRHQPGQSGESGTATLSYNQLHHNSWLITHYLFHESAFFRPHSGKSPEYILTAPRCLSPGINRQENGEQLKSFRTLNFIKFLKHTLYIEPILKALTNYTYSTRKKNLLFMIFTFHYMYIKSVHTPFISLR